MGFEEQEKKTIFCFTGTLGTGILCPDVLSRLSRSFLYEMSQQEKWSMNAKQCPLANSSVTSLTVLSFQLLIGILCAVPFCSISYFSTCLCTISLLKKILSCRVNFQGIFYSPVFYSARSTLSYIHFTRFIYCLYVYMTLCVSHESRSPG